MRSQLLVLLTLNACAAFENEARKNFEQKYTCPPEQVTAVRVTPYAFVRDAPPRANPPPDVAADPARLKFWNEEQDKAQKQAAKPDTYACPTFLVQGCGQKHRLCCDYSYNPGPAGGIVVSGVNCEEEEHSTPISVGALKDLQTYELFIRDYLNADFTSTRCVSWSQSMGLLISDVIVAVDDQTIPSCAQAASLIRQPTPAPHKVRVLRGKDSLEVSLPPPPPF